MGLYSGELIIGKMFASDIWGVYFQESLLTQFYGICLVLAVKAITKFYMISSVI